MGIITPRSCVVVKINELSHIKYLEPCLVCQEHSVSASISLPGSEVWRDYLCPFGGSISEHKINNKTTTTTTKTKTVLEEQKSYRYLGYAACMKMCVSGCFAPPIQNQDPQLVPGLQGQGLQLMLCTHHMYRHKREREK